jgi:Mn-dependent DtxR family transcriptional regulator
MVQMSLTAPSEDYLERILELFSEKGYARVVDIAKRLQVKPASVTRMLQKLEASGHITREPYRGFVLTAQGKKVGLGIRRRHQVLERFLQLLRLPKNTVERDIEGLEHSLSDQTVRALEKLVRKLAPQA